MSHKPGSSWCSGLVGAGSYLSFLDLHDGSDVWLLAYLEVCERVKVFEFSLGADASGAILRSSKFCRDEESEHLRSDDSIGTCNTILRRT